MSPFARNLLIVVGALSIVFTVRWSASRHGVGGVQAITGNDDTDGHIVVETFKGRPALRLSNDHQSLAGIRLSTVQGSIYRPEMKAFGSVVDIQPLLEFRRQYNTLQAELDRLQASLTALAKSLNRVRAASKETGNVSKRRLEETEAKWHSERLRIDAKRNNLDDFKFKAEQQWSPKLTEAAISEDPGLFRQLMDRRQKLLLVTLGPRETLPEEISVIFVDGNDDRSRASEALLIAPAPPSDEATQGQAYYFHTDADRLKVDMRVDVWIPKYQNPLLGVLVPTAAVIWHGGKPWVYVAVAEDLFQRYHLLGFRDEGEHWFVSGVLAERAAVVVRGGQMLLSEEFRWQIPEQNG